jgi:cytochrome P450
LARLELRIIVEALLKNSRLELVPGKKPVNAVYPASGFATLPLLIQR